MEPVIGLAALEAQIQQDLQYLYPLAHGHCLMKTCLNNTLMSPLLVQVCPELRRLSRLNYEASMLSFLIKLPPVEKDLGRHQH